MPLERDGELNKQIRTELLVGNDNEEKSGKKLVAMFKRLVFSYKFEQHEKDLHLAPM